MKEYTHCGITYKIGEKIAEYHMEKGPIDRIFLSNKKHNGVPLCLMFVYKKFGDNKAHLSKITDAFSFWIYWIEEYRQAWIMKRKDTRLFEEARKVIVAHKKKVKDDDALPEVYW